MYQGRPSSAPPGAALRGTEERRRWVWALYLVTVAVYSDMYVTQPVLPLLSTEYGLTPAQAGESVSAVVLAIALGSLVYGPLSDALGRRRVMVGTALLLAVPTFGCALTRTFPQLLALRAAQGLLIPGVTAVSVALCGDELPPAELAPVVGGVIAASVAGGLLGRVGSGMVAAAAGWRAAFVLFGAVTLAGALGLARELPRKEHRGGPGWLAALRGMARHLADPPLLGGFLVAFALFFAFIGVFTYLPYRLTAAPYHLSTALVSSVYVVYLAGVLVSPVAGRLAARVPSRALIAAGFVVAGAGVALTLARPLALVVLGLVVLCLGMFTAQAVAPAFVNRTAREAKGGASALYLTFYYLGGTLGSVLPGHAWQRAGWPGVAASCGGALGAGLLADLLLCRRK
ncbi:MFS transporter [Anaeromyxobacter paludicola]|uniref:MFS transporter n=1 Tax=Anaeromyxobacter paludicola TaxID=2918171 RepID=A0ABN6N6B5_9BACT|nr:MFS transporter [Anaeromyxobacter paludicola]BDG08711.1 MFS transporter [Anaeromyxobacter paludicola]